MGLPRKKMKRKPRRSWMEGIFGGRGTGTGCMDATGLFMDNQLLVIINTRRLSKNCNLQFANCDRQI